MKRNPSRTFSGRCLSALCLSLTVFALAAVVAPVRAGGPQEDPIVSGEVIVRLEPGVILDDFLNSFGATLIDSIDSRRIYKVSVDPGQTEQIALQMNADPRSAWAEANYTGFDPEGRTGSFYVTGIDQNQYANQYPRERIGLPGAHAVTRGAGMIIALLDTGVDTQHPGLQGAIAPGGFNFIDNNNNVLDIGNNVDEDGDGQFDESVGHGTFVAGLLRLTAPDAMIMPIKVLTSDGNGDGFLWAKGVFHAVDQGVDVINMSLGSTYEAQALIDALDEARAAGIIAVGAAGNQATNQLPEYPATEDDFAIGVAASNFNDQKSSFSNYEKHLVVAAPGSDGVYSFLPTQLNQGLYGEWDGTSFSTAFVSGTAALVLAANPDWPKNASRLIAMQTALELSAEPMNDQHYQNGELGGGRLNALGALNAAGMVVDSFETVIGTVLSGTIGDIIDGDDGRWIHTRSQFGFSVMEPNLVDLRFYYHALNPLPLFEVKVQSRINQPNGTARVRLRNWSTNQMQQIGQHPIGMNWVLFDQEGLSGATFIRAADGRLELSLKHVVVATFSALGFDSFFDEIDVNFD